MLALKGRVCCQLLPSASRGPLNCNVGGVRTTIAKHFNPNNKKLRGQKTIKIDLPDYQELKKPYSELTKEQIRSKLKERGIQPYRHWSDRPFFIPSTSNIFEPYVPPEGDGKVSIITAKGAKQKIERVEKKGKSLMAIRKIRSYDEDFDQSDFVKLAQDIYIQAHKAMINKNRDELIRFVTERAYPEVVNNIRDKTLVWDYVASIEVPRVVHLRCTDVITKENIYAQITVRFHSQQILAVYDRFGRLMHGSETLPKDVLEYVVFEKHMANKYGVWRIHDKIIPEWMPAKEPCKRTFAVEVEEEQEETSPQETTAAEAVPEPVAANSP